MSVGLWILVGVTAVVWALAFYGVYCDARRWVGWWREWRAR